MKTVIRIIVTMFVFVASFFFIYWLPFSLIPGAREIATLPEVVSLILAIAIGVFVWKKTSTTIDSLASHILVGGIIVGAIGFISGFFGPIIFNWGGNQGPLFGIFFTGPLGFMIGLISGAIYWKIKRRKHIAEL